MQGGRDEHTLLRFACRMIAPPRLSVQPAVNNQKERLAGWGDEERTSYLRLVRVQADAQQTIHCGYPRLQRLEERYSWILHYSTLYFIRVLSALCANFIFAAETYQRKVLPQHLPSESQHLNTDVSIQPFFPQCRI